MFSISKHNESICLDFSVPLTGVDNWSLVLAVKFNELWVKTFLVWNSELKPSVEKKLVRASSKLWENWGLVVFIVGWRFTGKIPGD